MNDIANNGLRESLIKTIRAVIFERGYDEDPMASYCIMYNFTENKVFATQWNEDAHSLENESTKCIYKVKGLMFSPDILSQYMGEEYDKDNYDTMLSDYLEIYSIAESIVKDIIEEVNKYAGYAR